MRSWCLFRLAVQSGRQPNAIGGAVGFLYLFAAIPCIAVSVAVSAFSAAVLGPDAALRNSAAVSAALAVVSAALAAWCR